jgi:HEAT repeat protein
MYRTLGTMLLAAALLLASRCAVDAQIAVKMAGKMAIVEPSGQAKAANEAQSDGGDEDLLRSVGIPTDGPGLLTFFRLRSGIMATPDRLASLIEQLGDKSPIVAQKASGELASLGAPAVPFLRQAVKDPDRHQIARLSQRCLQALEQNPGQLSSAAARLMVLRRPPGSPEALLTFLPCAEDEGVIEEVRLALASVAFTGGKADPALLKAVQDGSPIRRALAIDTLCHNGITPALLEQLPLRKLLQDRNPAVRLRAALALARSRDAKAVSTLITLLTELPLDQARQAEEFLSELAGEQAPKATLGGDSLARQKCRDAWATWWQASEESDRLLDEVRKRTVTDGLRQKCEDLIKKLGDADFTVREKAQAEVKAMGSLIVPLLRQAARDKDLEVRSRARDCLSEMERDKNVPLALITPRLIALRKPAGAAETLLSYIPYAEEDVTLPEIQLALNAVAFQNGKIESAVVRSLSDSQGARRAAAAEALCLGGDRTHLPAIRKLMSDSDPSVRLKVALALAGIGQRDAVLALIDVLADLPAAQSEPAEEYLQRLAGDNAPNPPSGDDNTSRKKRRDVWAAWWKTNGERVALVERYPQTGIERYLGHILLVIANTGEVMELDKDRKVRWHLTGLMNPRDVQVLANDRILIAEWNAQRVTERNRRGDIIWQKQTQGCFPISAQRLRNGHTFIACQNKLMEVDRAGNEIYSISRANDVIMARKMRDGQIILVNQNSQCIRLDTTGKQLKSYNVQMVWQTGVNILPNGHVLIPATWINRVMEYDNEGKVVWQANATQPCSAARLRNGNVLIAPQMWPSKVTEVDPSGKQVSEIAVANFPYRIRTR